MRLDPNIFRAYDIRGVVGESVTTDAVHTIARGYGSQLRAHGPATIVLGRDLRPSSEELAASVAEGLRACGCDVVDLGQVPIPMVYFAAERWGCAGGVGVTASHKPARFNGLKLRRGAAPYYGDDLRELHAFCERGSFRDGAGAYARRDVFPEYFATVEAKFARDCGLSICLDIGNGCGGFTAPRLLRSMGCEVDVIFGEPDGTFPNRSPDPLEPGALALLSARVRHTGADLGMAIDADGDRLAVVDDRGALVSPDKYAIVICDSILQQGPATFVSEVRCSQMTIDFVRERGGHVELAACGYPYILAEMARVDAPLGFETTGHIFFDDADIRYDDAAFCAARLAAALGGMETTLREVIASAPAYCTSEELRLECSDDIKGLVVEEVIARFEAGHEMNTVDGARIVFDGGWGLIRASNTGEELVMRFEGATEAACEEIAVQLRDAVTDVMSAHREGQ